MPSWVGREPPAVEANRPKTTFGGCVEQDDLKGEVADGRLRAGRVAPWQYRLDEHEGDRRNKPPSALRGSVGGRIPTLALAAVVGGRRCTRTPRRQGRGRLPTMPRSPRARGPPPVQRVLSRSRLSHFGACWCPCRVPSPHRSRGQGSCEVWPNCLPDEPDGQDV